MVHTTAFLFAWRNIGKRIGVNVTWAASQSKLIIRAWPPYYMTISHGEESMEEQASALILFRSSRIRADSSIEFVRPATRPSVEISMGEVLFSILVDLLNLGFSLPSIRD